MASKFTTEKVGNLRILLFHSSDQWSVGGETLAYYHSLAIFGGCRSPKHGPVSLACACTSPQQDVFRVASFPQVELFDCRTSVGVEHALAGSKVEGWEREPVVISSLKRGRHEFKA